MTTFLAIAENSKLDFVSFSAGAKGKLEKVDGRGFMMTEVVLRPKLLISHAKDAERAGRILEKAEKHCLISNSIKTATSRKSRLLISQRSVVCRPKSVLCGEGSGV
jgi:organic hydroperoxide reductase OsmC/OhrA